PRSLRACSRDDPECGARRGVLRRRLVTARLGRPGTPPARHYDLASEELAARFRRQMPAVVGRRAPKETEARPRGPKTATVERREASVPRHGTQGASLGAWHAALWRAARVLHRAPERFSALRPPLGSGWVKHECKTRTQTRRGNEMGCLTS